MKEKLPTFALLAVGAIFVIWYLMRNRAAAGTAPGPDGQPVVTASDGSAVQSYPNVNPIKLGDIVIGPTPIQLSYNQPPGGQNSLPTLHVAPAAPVTGGERPGCCDDCDGAGVVSVLNFKPGSFAKGMSNLTSAGNLAALGAGKVIS